MKKTILVLCLMVFIFVVCCASADSKTVQLGNTGITCQVDTKYDVITSSNKKEYSQAIQSLFTTNNIILFYSPEEGYYAAYYDQGKNFQKYDMSNKKTDELKANYMDYVGTDLSSLGFSSNYDVSVYDSGKAKWIRMDFSDNYVFFFTVQGNRSVSLFVYPQAIKNIKDIEMTLDSFSFGKPSLWDNIKSIAGNITNWGRNILGDFGAIIVWIIIGPSIIGFVLYVLIFIITIIASLFSKRR